MPPALKSLIEKNADGIVAIAGPARRKKLKRPEHSNLEKNLVIVINGNALLQFLADLILEILHLIPTRINHLSLTLLNAFIAFKTLSAVKKGKFQFLHEDCQFLWLMEICLIAGDVYYMFSDEYTPKFLYVRLAFILCSVFNVIAISHIIIKYKFFNLGYVGHKERRQSMGRIALRTVVSLWREDSNKHNRVAASASQDPEDGEIVANIATAAANATAAASTATAPADSAGTSDAVMEGDSIHHPIFGRDFGGQSDSEDEDGNSKRDAGDRDSRREDTSALGSEFDNRADEKSFGGSYHKETYRPVQPKEDPSSEVIDLV